MRLNRIARTHALVVMFAIPTALQAAPTFLPIARSGEAFPGRTDTVYTPAGTAFTGARSIDPNGDIYFYGRGQTNGGGTVSDLLVYRSATAQIEPYARTGDSIAGVPAQMSWGAVGGYQPGAISHLVQLQDGTPGNAAAVVVTHADGTHFVAARQGQQPPGYEPASAFATVGLASGAFLDVNMNRSGAVSFGGRFRDAGGTLRYGYYLTRPGQAAERIVDSTMSVPNHPTATWVNSDNIAAPFDIYTPGLDDAGNAYFRAKYRETGVDRRAFFKRSADGAITPIADAGSPDAVPGLPGNTYLQFRAAGNNQAADVAFAATMNGPAGTFAGAGVFAARGGGSLTKVLAYSDPVPGIPEATNHQPGLIAMSNSGHLLLTDNYFLSGLGGQSLILYNPDGSAEPVLRFNETPGFPGGRAGLTTQADMNSQGDAVFITSMNSPGQTSAAFAYLNDTNELLPILHTGEMLDGKTVLSFDFGGGAVDVLGSIAASAGPISFDDSRMLTLHVNLRDAAGVRSEALYAVIVPEPSSSGGLLALAAAALLQKRAFIRRPVR